MSVTSIDAPEPPSIRPRHTAISGLVARAGDRSGVDAVLAGYVERALADPGGARWFFRQVVEPLCDSFDAALQGWHDRVMARLIGEALRRDPVVGEPAGAMPNEASILERAASLTSAAAPYDRRPDMCIVPSRVTIGADVTVTGAVLGAVRQAWPDVPVALIGDDRHIAPLFGGLAGVEVWHQPYPRHGEVRDRLRVWHCTRSAIRDWCRQHPLRTVLVLDPDSRMTQLGLLSVAGERVSERVFRGRSAADSDLRDLGALAADWARTVCGVQRPAPSEPRILVPAADRAWGAALMREIRARQPAPVVVVSLGTGGNDAKATSVEHEVDMLLRLGRRASLVVDAGATDAEARRAEEAVRTAAAREGRAPWILDHAEAPSAPFRRDPPGCAVLLRRAAVAGVAGVIAAADGYAGYDSAFQHVASAVGVTGAAIFVDPPSPTFVRRWCPSGITPIVVAAGAPIADRVDAALATTLARTGRRARA
ncbi:hypothetical protein [Dactylosporangium sp. CA-139066]|uniref:hypothetical protein n=1 Tax=Dactylosporangium sp. CA-139066 TaxID=3239930 RepID=UPI003D904437